jgi:hypothetical protein
VPVAEQIAEQGSDQKKPWRIPAKTDGRAYLLARKRAAVEVKARELSAEIGGFDDLPPFKRALLLKAAELLLESKPADLVRTSNALRQIFNSLGLAASKRKLMRLPAR